jgi:hypothetical protein
MIFFQIKGDILAETIYCPPEKAVLLASYATQVSLIKHSEKISGDL